MDNQQGSGTATLPSPPAASYSGYEPRPPARRTGRAATKWFLVVPFVLLAPLAILAWSVTPRITSPGLVAEEAVDIGLTESARAVLLDSFASELAERRESPLAEDTLREVYERSLTQEWFDEQVLSVSGELDRWLEGSATQLPDLVIDLVPVKTALASDPEAMAMVADFIGCEGLECAPSNQPAEVALEGVPDRVALIGPDADPDGLLQARSMLGSVRKTGQFGPLILLGEFGLLIMLARRHGRLRFAGGLLFAVGATVVLAAILIPGWLGANFAESLPPDVPVEAGDFAALVAWTLVPARTMAYWLVGVGAAAYVGSFLWSELSRRPV